MATIDVVVLVTTGCVDGALTHRCRPTYNTRSAESIMTPFIAAPIYSRPYKQDYVTFGLN